MNVSRYIFFLKIRLTVSAFLIIFHGNDSHASTDQFPLSSQPQRTFEDPKSKNYKSSFQRFKDLVNTKELKANILGHLKSITTSTSCDPKSMSKFLNQKTMSLVAQSSASCQCCVVKEMARKESYDNAIGKCRTISRYCGKTLPFKDEAQFFEQTQLLSLNQKKGLSEKIKVTNAEIISNGAGIQDIEHLRYLWNLPIFYLFNEFNPQNYKLKFLGEKGYITPDPSKMRTSTTPYNHHYNKEKGRFFNPWPNAAPPIALINAASGILGSLDIKKAQRPWFSQRSYTIKPDSMIQNGIRATMVGHATVLLQIDGANILTDPVYFDIGAGNKEDRNVIFYKRIKAPGISFESLPQIDYVVLSHNHMDHLDIPSLRKIEARFPNVKYITPLGYTNFLRKNGLNTQDPNRIFELDWWDSIDFNTLRITALPTQHWCGRSVEDANKMLWSAFAFTSNAQKPHEKNIYFAGDTGFGPHFEEIAKKYAKGFDLALIPLGAYCPMHKEGGGHINPHEAVKVHQILKAKHSIGIHFDTFPLAQEPYGETAKTLAASRDYYHIDPHQFIALDAAEYVHINGSGNFSYHPNEPKS